MAVAASSALAVVMLLAGCDTKERESMKNQISALEQQVSQANATITTLQTSVKQLQADVQSVRNDRDELVARLDKIGSEVDSLRKASAKKPPAAKASPAVQKKTSKSR
jgi:septal ring factor EnvC (AmiA/AmiB activator)